MHTKYCARTPVSGAYNGRIVGQQPAYWTYADYIREPHGKCEDGSVVEPDAERILPATTTAAVGPRSMAMRTHMRTHPLTPNDSGAGITVLQYTYEYRILRVRLGKSIPGGTAGYDLRTT